MGELVLRWDVGHVDTLADVAKLGAVKLWAWPTRWRVDWFGDCAAGDATSREDARQQTCAFAKTLLRQTLAALDAEASHG